MKLKRILASVLTAAMVMTSVPVAGLGSTTAVAADVSAEKLEIEHTTVPSSTSNAGYGDNGGAVALTDGDTNTIWHTTYGDGDEATDGPRPTVESDNGGYKTLSGNNEVIFELKALSDVTKFRFKPKGADGGNNGCITKCSIYTAGADGVYTETPVANGSWEKNGDWKEADITPAAANVKYVKIVVTETYCSEEVGYISASEMEVYGTPASTEISRAELTVEAPAYQTVPAESITVPGDAPYTAGALAWTPAAEKFAANTEYSVSVVLTATGNATFAEGAAAAVNGKAATVTRGEDGKTLTVSYTFAGVADPTAAHTALKEEIEKQDVPVKNEKEDGTAKYTAGTWNTYKAAYDKAKALAELKDLTGKTPEEFESAKNEFLTAKGNLAELGDVTEIEDTPDVTVVAPVVGGTPAGAVLTKQGGLDTKVKVTYENMTIDEEGGISGKITAPNEYAENDVFNVTGATKFLFHFQMKTEKPSGKQSIVGKMDAQWGLQLDGGQLLLYGHLSEGSGWAQQNFTIPGDDWYGKWHDVVAIYDGDNFKMYVDGVASTTDPSHANAHGLLQEDAGSVFTVGYNYGKPGEDYTGKLKDLYMYVGDNVPEYTIQEGMTADIIKAMFAGVLGHATSDFEMTGLPPKEQSGYSVKSTTWTPGDETFGRYKDYTVEVVLEAEKGHVFKDDATAVLRTATGELPARDVTVTAKEDTMTITYTFVGEEHPRDTLLRLLAIVKDMTNEEKGVRVYTKASWNVFDEKRTAAQTIAADETLDPEAYATALSELQKAVASLANAATNCECALSDITGFEGSNVEMSLNTPITITLGTGAYTADTDCIKHAGVEAVATYVLGNNTAGATLDGNKLTVKKPGTVKVAFTVTLGEIKKSQEAIFTITEKKADAAAKTELSGAADDASKSYGADKDGYTADSWKAFDEAVNNAKTVAAKADATESEVAAAKKAIEDAIAGLKAVAADDLNALLNEVAGLNKADYSAESWNKLADVNNKVSAQLKNGELKAPADFAKAYNELKAAKDALVTKTAEAAKAEVTKAVNTAAPVFKAGNDGYTTETWNAFVAAYTAAQKGSSDPATMKKLADALNKAQAALKKAVPQKGEKIADPSGMFVYKITGSNTAEVAALGARNKSAKKVTVFATVKLGGKSFKVTSIGANVFKKNKKVTSVVIGKNVTKIGKAAFEGCKKLKTITVKSKVLKKVTKNAFKGINKKATIKVPKKKLAAYKKLFKKAKVAKTVKIK